MAYTFEQFEREHFLDRTPRMLEDEEVRPSFLDKIFKTLGVDQFISKMLDGELRQNSLTKIFAKLSTRERLEGLSSDERLEGLSSDEIKAYLQKIESEAQLQPSSESDSA